MDDFSAYLGFSAFPGIGPIRFKLLAEFFGSAQQAWTAPRDELLHTGLPQKLTDSFVAFRTSFSADDYRKKLDSEHIVALTQKDPRYPVPLLAISDPPIVLYVRGKRGNKQRFDFSRAIAIVGTRRPTDYGREMTQRIVSGLIAEGCPIISGMALGVDAVAHTTSIRESGQTIAVLGCGVDIIAPSSNASIYHALADEGMGAVVSEIPPGVRPDKRFFPMRNRIISALSRAVVVIEGAKDSGTLITARYAAEQGKDVFAVPGQALSPMSEAPNGLIKNGAAVATSADDILSALGISREHKKDARDIRNHYPENERRILEVLTDCGPSGPDELAKKTGIPVGEILSGCTVLELDGVIRNLGNSVYARLDESV